ncbi:flavin reductase family protein [Bradyrhizobium diazoefficiens]
MNDPDARQARTVTQPSGAQFRSIMRSMVAGVTVITTSHEGKLHGMTATAFSSVSAEPPTVLIVVNRSNRTHPLVSASKRFAVNLLSEDQQDIGQRFSSKLDDQFASVPYSSGVSGIPIIRGCTASIECETLHEVDVGTHTIFVGRVVRGCFSETRPLIYHDGRYKAVADLHAA